MSASDQLSEFIRSQFRSVWSLEILLHLKRGAARGWSESELLDALRASQSVIAAGLESLLAGGLILRDDDGRARYGPAGAELARLVDEAERLYAVKPDAVRRLIVLPQGSAVSAFADAFRLRRD